MTRGWGSLGGKDYGLQRIVYTGVEPFEIHSMKLTPAGFDLVFTQPLDPQTADKLTAYSLQSFTHYYWSTYGSPDVDRRVEAEQDLHRGRLAGTVLAQEPVDLTALDHEVDPVAGDDAAEALRDAAQLQRRDGGGVLPRRRRRRAGDGGRLRHVLVLRRGGVSRRRRPWSPSRG